MIGFEKNAIQNSETASEFMKQSIERIFASEPYQRSHVPEFGAGWTKVPAPNVSKLQRRTEVNNQVMDASFSAVGGYRALFHLLLKSQYVSIRKHVYDFNEPYWQLKVDGWRNSKLDLTVFSVIGTSVGRANRYWQFEGLWAFDTFALDFSDPKSGQIASDRNSLIKIDDHADIFVQPKTRYNGKMTNWKRWRDGVIASISETAAYGTKHIRKLSVNTFPGALLPTFDLSKRNRLYAAEHFYASFN